MRHRLSQIALHTTLLYAAIATAWVLGSDFLVGWVIPDKLSLTVVSIAKGLLFVAVTSLLLFGYLRRQLRRLERLEQAKQESQAFNRSVLASLRAKIAVIDEQGVILAINDAWLKFSADPASMSQHSLRVGDNYVHTLRSAAQQRSGQELEQVASGIETVLRRTSSHFEWEYSDAQSSPANVDYLMTVTPLQGNTGGAVITHHDISFRKQAERALRVSEERLRSILNTAADAMITIDSQGKIVGGNPASEKMFGYRQDELIGQPISLLMPEPFASEHQANLDRYLKTRQPRIIGIGREAVALRRDGTVFPVDLAVSEIVHLGQFTGIIRDISERKLLQRHILEIAASEQRRIGQELHDGIGQELTGLALIAGTLSAMIDRYASEHRGPGIPETEMLALQRIRDTAAKISTKLTQTNQHVHQLSHGILPVDADAQGLRAALQELVGSTNSIQGRTCRLECPDNLAICNNTVASHLFRIAQEAVNNALRHSQASEILLSLQPQPGGVILKIADNGLGIDTLANSHVAYEGRAHGMGLRTMEYRAGLIGGTLRIERLKTGGTQVSCSVTCGPESCNA